MLHSDKKRRNEIATILNLANTSMKDIKYNEGREYTLEVKQRQSIPIQLSLFMMRSAIFIYFCKSAQTKLTWSVVTLGRLVAISGISAK